jgi:hypothetical protein
MFPPYLIHDTFSPATANSYPNYLGLDNKFPTLSKLMNGKFRYLMTGVYIHL